MMLVIVYIVERLVTKNYFSQLQILEPNDNCNE